MDPLYSLARPCLFALDAERAHRLTLGAAASVARSRALTGLARAWYAPAPDPRLRTTAFGLDFEVPIGLAAGLDKDGEAIDLWPAFGFGFVELGTVTPGQGQPGNERPRLERVVEDRAVVNRMGFNNRGAAHLARRLAARRTRVPCGANLGKAKVTPLERAADDYQATLEAVWPYADYVVVNVSSPNTPNLRDLQAVRSLVPLLERVGTTNRRLAASEGGAPKPVLLKIAPDLAESDVDAIAEIALEDHVHGLIATNTTLRHDLLSRPPRIAGGVSGAPLAPRALELTRHLFRRLDGRRPIVGVGGIFSADDVFDRIAAGATLVQVYTALIYAGPKIVSSMVQGLGRRLSRDGQADLASVRGRDA